VPGEEYALFFHVPEGTAVSRVHASAEGGPEVPVHQELSGRSLKVSFEGRPEAVAWKLEFAAAAAGASHPGHPSSNQTRERVAR
jgi:hypothetical protein